jgi:hypothetical protein
VRYLCIIASITRRFVTNPTNRFFPAQQLRFGVEISKDYKNDFAGIIRNVLEKGAARK